MPSPVSTARQCLTDDAARALDDAVSVARRRSHSQTTSLHAVSALLALPSSSLRDACFRSRTPGCPPPRLQFRALELCVGVSLDRLPSSKSAADSEPLVSNALMAAIKRSQANQRRHPDSFHLQQIHYNNQAPSVLKVELKHFIGSILDDPVVSRVFGEAGFISYEIKSVILSPPILRSPRFPRAGLFPASLFPPNLADGGARPGFQFGEFGFGFPFSGTENCRRIGEVLAKPERKGRNPLLLGACASDALKRFVERVRSNGSLSFLPSEVAGISVFVIESEDVIEFVANGGRDGDEKMGRKLEELGRALEGCTGRGIVASFGDLEVLIGGDDDDAVSYLVSKLTGFLENFRGKFWLIGAAASYDVYGKFLRRFPAADKDWDLQLLPITSSASSVAGFGLKSSLLGSFVPFGGFFPTASDLPTPISSITQPVAARCHLCNAKYEQEVAAFLKTRSADQRPDSLPSWLKMVEQSKGKAIDASKIEDDDGSISILALQKKWNDICHRVHQTFPNASKSQAVVVAEDLQSPRDRKSVSNSSSGSRDSSLNRSQNTSIGVFNGMQNLLNARPVMQMQMPEAVSESKIVYNHLEVVEEDESTNPEKEKHNFQVAPCASLRTDCTSSSSVTSVTTDLGLGTLYPTGSRELLQPVKLPDNPPGCSFKEQCDHLSSTNSTSENPSRQMLQSSPPRVPFDISDFKKLRTLLVREVNWQDSAVSAICQALLHCQAGGGKRGSTSRNDIWLTFLGPDRIGKKKIASALAGIVSSSHKNVISVDLGSQHGVTSSNSVFQYREFYDDVNFRGKTVVDYIAAEMKKKPHSVIFLEDVEQADLPTRASLSQAISKGKFADSHGREISTNNMIFITTTSMARNPDRLPSANRAIKYSEESILGAKRWQMQLLVGPVSEIRNATKVTVLGKASSASPYSVNKRKLQETTKESMTCDMNVESKKRSLSFLDLNLPVQETEEDSDCPSREDDSISDTSVAAWMQEFLNQADENVEFKPFDFDALSEKIAKAMSIQMERVFGGEEVMLEIEDDAMVEMIAASWSSEREEAIVNWVENVVGRAFPELRHNYQMISKVPCAVKLVSRVGVLAEELAPGICLPSRINL